MALLNLSNVTDTLVSLLTKNISVLLTLEPDNEPPFEIVAQSPDKIPNTTIKPTLSVYLYHAREDAHYKNAEPSGGTPANNPLALSLYYVITAHKYDETDQLPAPLIEQDFLGYALKTLHDYPIVSDTTQIGSDLVMPLNMLGGSNKLQIIYRPISPEEAMTFWSGDDERLIRFSAFYEVRVVFMPHAQPTHLPGYVLSVGNYVLPTGVMSIVASESVVRFTPPGSDTITLVASPARVALSSVAPPGETPNNQLTLRGTRLGGGRLVLRSPLFETPNNQITVVAADNPSWDISVTPSRLVARVQSSISRPPLAPQVLLPGIYGASIEVSSTYQLPGGLTKTIVTRSNEVAISITPFITHHEVTFVGDPTLIEIFVDQTDLEAPELAGELSVVVANQVYKPGAGADPNTFEYKLLPDRIVIGAPPTMNNPGIYPVRVIVRGSEAPPYWIEVAE